jgi:hypothetical protein
LREPENEGSMFLGSNVLEYLPLQNAVREMMRLPAVPISMSLHGHEK